MGSSYCSEVGYPQKISVIGGDGSPEWELSVGNLLPQAFMHIFGSSSDSLFAESEVVIKKRKLKLSGVKVKIIVMS